MTVDDRGPAPGGSLLAKVVGGGAPLIVASSIALFAPVLAYFWLPTSAYAVWVLGASVLTLGTNLDFGGPAYLAAFARAAPLDRHRRMLGLCIGASAAGALSVFAVAALAWTVIPNVRQQTSLATGLAMLGLVTFAAICRSTTSVVAGYALAGGALRDRAVLLVAGPVLQVAAIAAVSRRPPSVLALAVAVALAGVPHVALGAVIEHRVRSGMGPRADGREPPPFRGYAFNRLGVSLFGMVLSQGDRWLVAALIGTPGIVAALDIVQRASQPARLVLISAGQALQSEFSRASVDPRGGIAVLHRSERLVWKLASPVVIGGWLFSAAYLRAVDIESSAKACLLALPVLVAFEASNSLRTSYAITIHRIGPELEARVLSVGATAVFVAVAIATADLLALVAAPAGFALGTAWYYWRIRRFLHQPAEPVPRSAR